MGKTVINVGLSQTSIQNAIKQIEEYKKSLLAKCEDFTKELATIGEQVALQKIGESPLGKTITFRSEIEPTKTGCKAILVAVGENKQSGDYATFNTLLAVEFGAGIHYNPTANPDADKLGMGVGTFPGQTHAFDPNGWYYWDEKEEKWKHSYGTRATMPMYNATVEMATRYKEIANKVFS